jgi:hypothetical protein
VDAETWLSCYDRLSEAYGKPKDGDRKQLYFEQLREMPGPTMRLAVKLLINDHEGRQWPTVAVIRRYCSQASKQVAPAPDRCPECGGNLWIDAPNQVHFTLTYANYVERCPVCRPKVA